MKSKHLAPILILTLILVIFISGCIDQPIGGETDEHGCLLMAGYTWNESLGFCLREWELNENQREAAGMVIAPLSYYVTVTRVDVARCPGCFAVHLQRNDNRQMLQVTLENWEIRSDGSTILNNDCVYDSDCVVFGETGDCNSGCYNKDNLPSGTGGECFRSAPIGCKCVNDKCEGIFEGEMSYSEARQIAEQSECVEEGDLTEHARFSGTNNWEIDLEPFIEKEGCNPVCVVNPIERTAEINWRCTGVLSCAEEGEQFSQVYEEYPEHCCEGLKEWQSGFDTSISVADECYETGIPSGLPVGTCIKCGDGICGDIENPCNCPDDCIGKDKSDFPSIEECCQSNDWNQTFSKACEETIKDFQLCELC